MRRPPPRSGARAEEDRKRKPTIRDSVCVCGLLRSGSRPASPAWRSPGDFHECMVISRGESSLRALRALR